MNYQFTSRHLTLDNLSRSNQGHMTFKMVYLLDGASYKILHETYIPVYIINHIIMIFQSHDIWPWHLRVKSRSFGVHWVVYMYHRSCIIRHRSFQAERPLASIPFHVEFECSFPALLKCLFPVHGNYIFVFPNHGEFKTPFTENGAYPNPPHWSCWFTLIYLGAASTNHEKSPLWCYEPVISPIYCIFTTLFCTNIIIDIQILLYFWMICPGEVYCGRNKDVLSQLVICQTNIVYLFIPICI